MRKKKWHEMIINIDLRCMNIYCKWNFKITDELSAHHIKYRSEGGKDIPANGITFCHDCDHKAHNGGFHPKAQERVSARVFVYLCLKGLEDKPYFRWGIALKHLEKTSEVQRWLQ